MGFRRDATQTGFRCDAHTESNLPWRASGATPLRLASAATSVKATGSVTLLYTGKGIPVPVTQFRDLLLHFHNRKFRCKFEADDSIYYRVMPAKVVHLGFPDTPTQCQKWPPLAGTQLRTCVFERVFGAQLSQSPDFQCSISDIGWGSRGGPL